MGESMGDTIAPWQDRGVRSIHFNGQDGWPPYSHPGGTQIVGDVLVVSLEWWCPTYYVGVTGDCTQNLEQQGAIALIDVSEPLTPTLIHYQLLWPDDGLGVVGVTYVKESEHPMTASGGRYLFIMTWGDGNKVRFAWSDTDDLKTTRKLWLEGFQWVDPGEGSLGGDWRAWQTLNFVRDTNGTLYVIGADKTTGGDRKDWLGLFEVDVSKLTSDSYQNAIRGIAEKHLKLNDPVMGCLDATSGIYVSPSGQLILYTATHENDGPKDNGVGTVQMGEFRNIDVYTGAMARDRMCPWVELYEDEDGWNRTKRSIMLDYQDRQIEDWGDLRQEDGWNDLTSAMRTYLAPGQSLSLYPDVYYAGNPLKVVGNGTVQVFDMGHFNANSFNDKTSSVRIFPFADPGGPYNGDEGSSIPLHAANRCYLDDEAEVTFTWSADSPVCTLSDPAARQPSLTCSDDGNFTIELTVSEGSDESSTIAATVTAENVAPVVTADGSDIDENGWATVSGTITDPGTQDTFTVIIDWGEGSDTHSYPAGTTAYSEQHQYSAPNLTGVYLVEVTVIDKDGGIGSASTFVNGELVFLPLVVKD
jgi:hypothetical protein